MISPSDIPNDSPRIYADGIYDLFHFGHALQFKQIKDTYPNAVLLIGVCSDALTLKYKRRTILTNQERCESVRHCRYVDEVIENAPWIITPEFIKTHRIDFVAHDVDPYPHPETGEDIYMWLKSTGLFIATSRTDGISTSEIIARITANFKGTAKTAAESNP